MRKTIHILDKNTVETTGRLTLEGCIIVDISPSKFDGMHAIKYEDTVDRFPKAVSFADFDGFLD